MLQKHPGSMRRALRALMACAVAGLILGGGVASKAYAADDEDEAIDVRVLRGVLRGLGLKHGDEESIDYRERSPLVVPPSMELPPPEDPTLAERNPAWPDDPDIRKARQVVKRQKKAIDWGEEERALRPSELNRGGAREGPAPGQAMAKSADESARVMSPKELGFKGWGSLKRMFGAEHENESGTFADEPRRTELTQPPPGYLTPSPTQPYGVGKNDSNWKPQAANPMDQPVGDAATK